MTVPVRAYAATSPGRPLEILNYELGDLHPDEVRIEVSHSGLCRSDLDALDDRLGTSSYPLVAGHEIIGQVSAVGSSVTHLRVGQRVGVGPICNTCLNCEYCASGRDNVCSKVEFTIGGGRRGGFADIVHVPAAYAFPIPDSLGSENAAPLLCAGITSYAPISRHTTSESHVGVIGIGGLGHLALKFAAARGSEVTAISTSPRKADAARRFGAHNFVASSDAEQLRRAAGSLDFILSTVDADLNWLDYLNLLRPDGKICFVGASMGPIGVPAAMLIMGQYSLVGSAAGSRATTTEMLEFSARHQIWAETEVVPMSDINRAIERMRSGDAPFRFVLTHE
ncbi:NAD(P)-dependent alcohol dehydrogenase [Streptomyces sp. NBC_01264]|uniref:NAD(P)-dependent alcohol dehydrogenase n=1 Tax=Streptomyces sp. NBC_01264 TaxID=2903804 RepID=UPI002259C1A5|nr:NAD(P)-dependent alcohol dehydrogenase [Streptomyces sp. NBC_01264]MCX4775445.1 NAD(P)-dependent alcohol dehydrogenase [Streptomyces sp. NBC_01264]